MSEEQLRLMAQVVLGLYQIADLYTPYNTFGIDVGRCRYCGVVGEMRSYPDISYAHDPKCIAPMAQQLFESLKEQPK